MIDPVILSNLVPYTAQVACIAQEHPPKVEVEAQAGGVERAAEEDLLGERRSEHHHQHELE